MLLLQMLTICGILLLQMASATQFTLEALDCRHPSKITTGKLGTMCNSVPSPITNDTTTRTLILQNSDTFIVKAYRCELRYSEFNYICGFLSHTKLYQPPNILQPQIIKTESCEEMAAKGMFTKEDGTLINIKQNQQINYSFIRHGTLYYSHQNVACEGATMSIQGEEVSGLVDMIAAEVSFKEISIEHTLGKSIDLDLNIELPHTCSLGNSCQVGPTAYVISNPVNRCPLSLVRTLQMTPLKLAGINGPKDALINYDHKILLTKERKEVAPRGCLPVFGYWATEYPDIKIVTVSAEVSLAEISNMQRNLDPSLLNIEVEMKITDAFLAHYFQQLIMSKLGHLAKKICTMNRSNLPFTELSPFHPNSLLRVRGDIVQELRCTNLTAVARLGDKRSDKCHSDSIPAWINNQPIRIQARTHLVLEDDPLDMVPCQASYMPLFLAADKNTILMANPEVQVVKLTIHHLDEDYLHLLGDSTNPEHLEFGNDLLYTQDEIHQFNNLIHFQRTKQRVLNALITDYCEGNTECGSYQPPAGTSPGFILDHIKDQIYSPFQIFFDWADKLATIGNVCSIAIVCFSAISITYKLTKVFWLSCKHKMGVGQAFKLGFFVDTALMKALVDTAPPVPLTHPDQLPMTRPTNNYNRPRQYQTQQPVIEELPLNPMTTQQPTISPTTVATYEAWRNWN